MFIEGKMAACKRT